jgi:hypothetical protein
MQRRRALWPAVTDCGIPLPPTCWSKARRLSPCRELLGHASIASSERYAKVSNQKVKQVYLKTIKKVMQQSKV